MKFGQYLKEAKEKTVYFAFGRFNPPTSGHAKLVQKISSIAGSDDWFVFGSNSQDPKKNPFPADRKLYWLHKMFPRYRRNIRIDSKIKTFIQALAYLHKMGKYDHVVMVAGQDRLAEFQNMLDKYNGYDARDFFEFKTAKVVSAGARDPDADDVTGMSASKLRALAVENNFGEFKKGVVLDETQAKEMFFELRKHMKVK